MLAAAGFTSTQKAARLHGPAGWASAGNVGHGCERAAMLSRWIGWALVYLAIGAFGIELLAALELGAWQPLSIRRLWFVLDAAGLDRFASAVDGLSGWLWAGLVLPLMRLPAWLPLAALAAWLILRRPRPRRLFR